MTMRHMTMYDIFLIVRGKHMTMYDIFLILCGKRDKMLRSTAFRAQLATMFFMLSAFVLNVVKIKW